MNKQLLPRGRKSGAASETFQTYDATVQLEEPSLIGRYSGLKRYLKPCRTSGSYGIFRLNFSCEEGT